MNEAGIVALVVSLITGAGGFYTALTTKRKIDADSESVSVATMRAVLEEVRTELEKCHNQRLSVMARLTVTEKRITSLETFIRLNTPIDPGEINGEPI